MASVLSLKTDIKKLKAAIASKATSGAIKTKLRGKLTNLENQLDKLQPNKRKPKTTGPKNESALVRVAKKRRTNQGLSTSKEDIERDAIRPAKKAGKRISANGNRYYEYRDNRIDNRQPPRKYRKLADGGMMAKGGETGAAEIKIELEDSIISIYHGEGGKKLYEFEAKEGDWNKIWELFYKLGGKKMAQGGQIKPERGAASIIVALEEGEIFIYHGEDAYELYRFKAKKGDWNKIWDLLYKLGGNKMAHGGHTQGYDDKKDESLGMTRGKLSLKDFVGNRKQKEHSRRDDARFEERGMMAKGGDLSLVKKKYEENEDENAHSENVVLLAKHFGTKADLAKAKEILALHEKEGYLSSENGKKRTELHYKLIDKARSEMGKQGIKFEKGGYMAKGGKLDKYYLIDAIGKDGKLHDVAKFIDKTEAYTSANHLQETSQKRGNKVYSVGEKEGKFKDGGYMAKGGKTKEKEVVRGYFEDEAYEYGSGGEVMYLTSTGNSQRLVTDKSDATPMFIMDAEYYIKSNPKNSATMVAEKIDKTLPDGVGKNYIVKITKEHKMDHGGYMADGGNIYGRQSIKSYYVDTYPTDNIGQEINDEASFEGLNKALDCKIDVYEYLGVGDSLVRERVFWKLSDLMGVSYDVIYDKWLQSDYAKGGYMAKGGKTKDQEVVRGYFEDEAYEYGQGGNVRFNNVSIHISKNTEEDMRNAGFTFDPKGNAPLYYNGKEVGYLSNFNGVMLNDEYVDELVPMFNTFRDAGIWNYRGWKEEAEARKRQYGNKMADGGETSSKNYKVQYNVGKSKYVINYHDGEKKHDDGSPFYDIAIFKNMQDFMAYKNKLNSEGYKEMAHGGMMADGGMVKPEFVGKQYFDKKENKLLRVGYQTSDIPNVYNVVWEDGEHSIYSKKNIDFLIEKRIWTETDEPKMEHGGSVAKGNYEMLMSQAKEVMHHAEELMQVVKPNMDIEAWVVSKAERATTDLSDITHYLDGLKMAMGGMVKANAHKVNA